MNREPQNETNENKIQEPRKGEDKNIFKFYPINEKEKINSRMNSNILNIQNSASKNFKNEIKIESANAYL